MERVVSDICGAHAQVAASAEIMLGVRLCDVTRQDVRHALWRDRTLVKTVGLRGTLHLFPAGEVPYWMAANRLRFPSEDRRLERLGIKPAELEAVIRVIADAVGPTPITRVDLEREIESRVGGWSTARNQGWMGTYQNWPMALGWAAALGLVCYGPGDGGRSTFVRLADWARWREVEPMEGGTFALRRFLSAYGPSTVPEFARWFSIAPPLARQLFDALSGELVEVVVEGEKRWALAADDWTELPDASASVRLLPHFDVFVVGSHPRDRLIESGSPLTRLVPGTAAPFSVVLRGGRVAGVWERKPKGKRLLIRVDAYWAVKRKDRIAIEEQASRIAQILERECDVELGPVNLRPHA